MTASGGLPRPLLEEWEWQRYGACRDLDCETFFSPERERGPSKLARETAAKQVCRRCPVIDECRRHALQVGEPYGVWGGLTVTERAEIARAQRRSMTAS